MPTIREILQDTANAEGDQLVTLKMSMLTGKTDRMAAKLLLYTLETFADNTNGEVEDALRNALFWFTLFVAGEAGHREQVALEQEGTPDA